MSAVPWRWNTERGRGGLGLRANSAFGNNIFMDCGRTCFVPAVMEPGPGIRDGKWAIQKTWPFYSVLNTHSDMKECQFCPKSPLKCIWQWSLESGGFGKVPVERYFPSCVGLSLCPLFFHVQSCKKMLFFFQLGCICFPDCFYLCKKPCEDLGRFCGLIKSHISWALSFSLNSPSILSEIQYSNDNFLA